MANVDPIDFACATEGLDPEETLAIIVSKTFTTAETMINAKQVKNWIINHYKDVAEGDKQKLVEAHICAVSTNLKETKAFGILDERVFPFWDWVGGRYSVSSAVGMLPLSLMYSYQEMEKFLGGLYSVDDYFRKTEVDNNAALLLGLIGFYNTYIAGIESRAILPYCQALSRFPAHIQQVDMESNGKGVTYDGQRLEHHTGPIIFGEPGTNGQHSFYQLMHQGRPIAAEFIGFTKSQVQDSMNQN